MEWHCDEADVTPWGVHLRAEKGGLTDERGRLWRSVRAAFWEGQLGMPPVHLVEEQLELLLRVLSMLARRSVASGEMHEDLFGGDRLHANFYTCWLFSVGLAEQVSSGFAFSHVINREGRSVLAMLTATRPSEWVDLPIRDVVEAVRVPGSGPADEAREAALSTFERQAATLPYAFARERIGRTHVITLSGIDKAARIPMRRVIWSTPFADERVRDDLFGWLAQRVDRWEDWSGMASRKGEAALTRHLLTLLAAAPINSGDGSHVGAIK